MGILSVKGRDGKRYPYTLIGIIENPPEQEFLIANALSQLGNIGPPAKAAIPALEAYANKEGATYAPTAQWALDRIREKKAGE